jgi:hypothetical protein
MNPASTKMGSANVLLGLPIMGFCIALFLYAKRSRRKQGLELKDAPTPPGRLFTGHLFDLLMPSYHRTLHLWSQMYGEIFRINVLGLHGLVVCCPKIISHILGQERGTAELPKLHAYHELDMVRDLPFRLRNYRTTSIHALACALKTSTSSSAAVCP